MPKRRSHNPDSSIQQVHKANIHQPNRSSKFACLGPTFKCQIWIVQRLKFLISKMHNCKIWILTSLVHVHVAELNAKKIMSFQRPNVKAHNLEYTFQCLRIVSLVLHIMSKLILNVAKGLRLKPLYPMSQVLCPLSNFGSANMFFKNTSSAFRTTTSAHDAKSEIQRRRLTFNVELIQNLTAETHSPFKTFPCKSQSIDLSSNIPNSKVPSGKPGVLVATFVDRIRLRERLQNSTSTQLPLFCLPNLGFWSLDLWPMVWDSVLVTEAQSPSPSTVAAIHSITIIEHYRRVGVRGPSSRSKRWIFNCSL